jgi:type I restriction enzyme S subunit
MSENSFGRVALASVTTAIKDGTHGTHARVGEGVPFLSAKNITDSGAVAWDETDDCISESEYAQIHRTFRLEPGDLLLTIVGSLGRRAVFDGSKVTFQRSVAYVRPDTQKVSERFLFHWFAHSEFQQELVRRSNSTAQAGLYLGELGRTSVPECPLAEQVKIAEILDTLDSTIRQTEAIIEKLKQVKQGLLHDLLTRGIDANGELRPPQSQAPHLYKDSPLGWIPREWDVYGVLDIAPTDRQCILTGPFGAQLGQADFVSEGVPVLRIGNVQAGFIDWSDVQFVSHAKAGRLERFSVLPGDLLFARQGAPTGRNALADERANGALINYHIIRVAVDRERCEPVYLHALFNSDQSKGQVDQEKGRGTREGINSKQIAALRFALPHIEEQQVLVAHMTALGDAMAQESNFVAKLRLEKSGLMDDLLTGRVRVTPLLA